MKYPRQSDSTGMKNVTMKIENCDRNDDDDDDVGAEISHSIRSLRMIADDDLI